ncbi:MAG: periplasmic protein TonB [Blastocatellia bacterium]|jgi:TonB family protein|nr:periplasmic protein TonB [Blastocatellia bacterium]
MKNLATTLIAILFAVSLTRGLLAQEPGKPSPKPASATKESPKDQPKGEVDLALEELEKRNDGVSTVVGGEIPDASDSSKTGVLNGQALELVQPKYPAIAAAAHVSGKVTVLVLIDTDGKIMAAQIVDGHPLLREAALKAARATRFSQTLLQGKPVNILGTIIYNFVL